MLLRAFSQTQVRSREFVEHGHLGSEQVVLELAVGHHAPYAVLAEARRLDTQLPQDVQHGAEDVAVTLELYDDQVAGRGIAACLHIVELHIEVDGKPLGLAIVDQRNALELVAHRGVHVIHSPVHEPLEEFLVASICWHGTSTRFFLVRPWLFLVFTSRKVMSLSI